MENIFIKTNGKYHTQNMNFEFQKNLNKFLSSEITSLDEYISWVYQWKAYEKEIVAAIHFARKMKNSYTAKHNGLKTDESMVNYYHILKMGLRKTAKLFYGFREKKKDLFKKSEFFHINKVVEKELEYA